MGEGFENVAFAVPHTPAQGWGLCFLAPCAPSAHANPAGSWIWDITRGSLQSRLAQQPANVLIYHWTHQNICMVSGTAVGCSSFIIIALPELLTDWSSTWAELSKSTTSNNHWFSYSKLMSFASSAWESLSNWKVPFFLAHDLIFAPCVYQVRRKLSLHTREMDMQNFQSVSQPPPIFWLSVLSAPQSTQGFNHFLWE